MNRNYKQIFWFVLIAVIAILSRVGYEVVINTMEINKSFWQFIKDILDFILGFIAVIIWIRIAIKSEYKTSKLPWLLFLVLEPISGTIMFLSFGRDFRESNRYNKRLLMDHGQTLTHEPTPNFDDEILGPIDSEITDIYTVGYNMTKHNVYANSTKVVPMDDGKVYFKRLLEELDKATEFILFETYILRTDDIGMKVLDKLIEKAKNGVEVRLIYDAVGSIFLDRKKMRECENTGIEIYAFDPIQTGFFDTRITYRNHRKIITIDGKVGFIGGMNIASEYANMKKGYPPFRDTHLFVEGGVVNSMTEVFFKDYYYLTNELVSDDKYYPSYSVKQEGLVQCIPSGPDYQYPPIRNTYVKMFNNAKDSIKIITPYLALDAELVTSLIIAVRSGVKVDIIVPGKPDKKMIYLVTQSFFDELLSEGVNIHTYDDTFTHAKVVIIDDKLASCGSYNLDNRSANINFEAVLLLYKTGVEELVEQFNNDLTHCTSINPNAWKQKGFIKRMVLGLVNIAAPLV